MLHIAHGLLNLRCCNPACRQGGRPARIIGQISGGGLAPGAKIVLQCRGCRELTTFVGDEAHDILVKIAMA